jgi:hypothetical protein
LKRGSFVDQAGFSAKTCRKSATCSRHPHRQALGTYGAAARAKGVKDRIKTRDTKFGDAAGG